MDFQKGKELDEALTDPGVGTYTRAECAPPKLPTSSPGNETSLASCSLGHSRGKGLGLKALCTHTPPAAQPDPAVSPAPASPTTALRSAGGVAGIDAKYFCGQGRASGFGSFELSMCLG